MAATLTVPQHTQQRNFIQIKPYSGVVTLHGYGISVRVERGHLILEDGVGPVRRHGRFPRVNHGLQRLIVIGSDGAVSFSALRWLADQDAAFAMLERNGSVLATTGPVRPSDSRLRRAQSLAHQTGVAVQISRELISQKLDGQERIVRDTLQDSALAYKIAYLRSLLAKPNTVEAIRQLDSQAAQAYLSAWRGLPINFPMADYRRVP